MAVLLAAAVMMTGAAALAMTWTFLVADNHVNDLTSAQRRLELFSVLSGRIGEYALLALQTTESPEGQTDRLSLPRKRVQETFARLDSELAKEIARHRDIQAATLLAGRSRVLAFMRARFEFLDGQALQAIRDARAGTLGGVDRLRVALDSFASGFAPALGQAIEEERAAAKEAESAMTGLRESLIPGAAIAVGLVILLAALLYRALAAPLVTQISQVAAAAADIARGRADVRLPVHGHDELSLAMMRFNRMARLLERREAKLVADQTRLQEIVDARTAELRGANERLSDIDRARRRFFTDVSHELRTPLTVILGEADVTLRGSATPEDLRSALATIRSRARRLHRRVEDLLRVARSESGQLELEFEPVSVAELLEAARAGAEPAAKARGIVLECQPPPHDLTVEGDAEWLRQVVEGLVSNALRHSASGAAVRISATVDAEGSAAISVADDGEGIPADDLPRVFERFYRGASEREGSGFGIGLALARWVVERHGGSIELDSRTAGPDRRSGTTVTIRLPSMPVQKFAIGAAS
jgi:signal transduction histidine kinase